VDVATNASVSDALEKFILGYWRLNRMLISAYRVLQFAGIVALLSVSLWLLYISQAQGAFDDDDPNNDPNACHNDPDPANCDWQRGWYQAAVNAGHLSESQVQQVYPDMRRGEPAASGQIGQVNLYNDDDPNNDPNLCFQSTDPDCDWDQGWRDARASLVPAAPIGTPDPYNQESGSLGYNFSGADVTIIGEAPEGWVSAIQTQYAEQTQEPDVVEVRWLCPSGLSESDCSGTFTARTRD